MDLALLAGFAFAVWCACLVESLLEARCRAAECATCSAAMRRAR